MDEYAQIKRYARTNNQAKPIYDEDRKQVEK